MFQSAGFIGAYIITYLLCLTGASHSSFSRTWLGPDVASPTPFSLSQIKNPNFKPHNVSLTALYARSFLKHNRTMPHALKTAWEKISREPDGSDGPLESRDNGQITDGTDGLFVWPVRVGTPSQTLHVIFDTGSGDFWLWSWLLPKGMVQSHNFYNASASNSSIQLVNQTFLLGFHGASVDGLVWGDTLWVDGTAFDGSPSPIGVGGQPVECATDMTSFWQGLPDVDGEIGLTPNYNDSETPSPQQSWISYVLPHLDLPVFTLALVQDGIGTIDFGFIDPAKYVGDVAYTPVTQIPGSAGNYWAFNWTGFAVGNDTFNYTNIQIMTDSAGNVVTMPPSIVNRYYSQVEGATWQAADGAWVFPCTASLPNFTFGVGDHRYVTIGKHSIWYAVGDGTCYGGIQPGGEDSYIYMGIPFLNTLFVVHDYGHMQMGFANRTIY